MERLKKILESLMRKRSLDQLKGQHYLDRIGGTIKRPAVLLFVLIYLVTCIPSPQNLTFARDNESVQESEVTADSAADDKDDADSGDSSDTSSPSEEKKDKEDADAADSGKSDSDQKSEEVKSEDKSEEDKSGKDASGKDADQNKGTTEDKTQVKDSDGKESGDKKDSSDKKGQPSSSTEPTAGEKGELLFKKSTKVNSYTIRVTGDKESGIDKVASMNVAEINEKDSIYIDSVKKLNKNLEKKKEGEIKDIRLYHITFYDSESKPVTLSDSVKVRIVYYDKSAMKVDPKDEATAIRAFTVYTSADKNAKVVLKHIEDVNKEEEKKAKAKAAGEPSAGDTAAEGQDEDTTAADSKNNKNATSKYEPLIVVTNTKWVDEKDVTSRTVRRNVREVNYALGKDGVTGICVTGTPEPEEDKKTDAKNVPGTGNTNIDNGNKTDAADAGSDNGVNQNQENDDVISSNNNDAVTADQVDSEEESDNNKTEKDIDEDISEKNNTLTASDGNCKVVLGYDDDAGIPDEATLSIRRIEEGSEEYDTYLKQAASAYAEKENADIKHARFYDIKILDAEGKEVEPASAVTVKITFDTMSVENKDTVDLIHFEESGKDKKDKKKKRINPKRLEDVTVLDGNKNETINGVGFETDGFSVFGVISTVLTQTLDASDGERYRVTVTYDNTCGIPENAELIVTEIKQGDADFDDYLAMTAEKLGTSPEKLTFTREFDIKLRDPKTGEKYQPSKDVRVDIELLNQKIDKNDEVNVVHFTDNDGKKNNSNEADETKVDEIESIVKENTVEFTTNGFSVYVITGGTVYYCTYYFMTLNEYGIYAPYYFYTDQENKKTNKQTIKSGEKLFAPNNPEHPTDSNQTFMGWYTEDISEGGDKGPSEIKFDFDQPQVIDENHPETETLYAVFSTESNVRFHGQYDSVKDSYPIVESALVDHLGTINLNNYTAPEYIEDGDAFATAHFVGWSLTQVETPFDTAGGGQSFVISDTEYSQYTITGDTDLYPIYERIHWLSFNSGNSGTGATYFSPTYYLAGTGPSDLASHGDDDPGFIPTRPGYSFQGWYLDVENEGTDAQNGKDPQLTDANGYFIADFDNDVGVNYGVRVSTEGDAKKLLLSKNVTIYAKWAESNVDYSIIVWKKMLGSDEYAFSEQFKLNTTYTTEAVSIDDLLGETVANSYRSLYDLASYNSLHSDSTISEEVANPYYGFSYNEDKSLADTDKDKETDTYTGKKTLANDGSTVFNLYYDKNSDSVPGDYKLTFHYPDKTPTDVDVTESDIVYGGEDDTLPAIAGGASLKNITMPAAPQNTDAYKGYDFFWYADASSTTRVFFTEEGYNNYTDGPKVLYSNMPYQDLIIYGGFEKAWYLIKIDPNYGQMDFDIDETTGKRVGTKNSTYFWKTYRSDYIQEYTWIKREYVESESGNYYYVNHSYENRGPDRFTYYTDDISEATELTTFKYSPNTYLYDGWYQVLNEETGEESTQPYEFGKLIEGNVTLKLHWKRAGSYNLVYNADVVTEDGERLIGDFGNGKTELQDSNDYTDRAEIKLTQLAQPPEGYEFVGWKIRGDESGKVWYPGSDFILDAEYAVTVDRQEKVYLDAVYGRSSTATVVYHANGGSITSNADGGYPYELEGTSDTIKPGKLNTDYRISRDIIAGTVTVSGIVNNSRIMLSNGFGFVPSSEMGVTKLVGWYMTLPDGTVKHFKIGEEATSITELAEEYAVDIEAPIHLYAEWQVRVYFDLNPAEGHSWSPDPNVYIMDGEEGEHQGQYYVLSYVNAKLTEPAQKPSASDDSLFDFWSTRSDGDQQYAFEFDQDLIQHEMTLYAHWTTAVMVPYHVTDRESLTDDWAKTTHLRVGGNGEAFNLDPESQDIDLSSYVDTPADYKYVKAYFIDGETKRVITSIQKAGKTAVATYMDDNHEEQTITLVDDVVSTEDIPVYLDFEPINPLDSVDVKVVYMKETAQGNLEVLNGSTNGTSLTSPVSITYNRKIVSYKHTGDDYLNMDHVPEQNDSIPVGATEAVEFNQDKLSSWHMLPLLDDGTEMLSQSYYMLGVKEGATVPANISDFENANVTTDLKLFLQIRDNVLQWSFSGDEDDWTPLTEQDPTIYAIYHERGYELDITKTVEGEDTGISPDKTFRVIVSSNSIIRDSYEVEGTGYSTVKAKPATASEPGTIELTIKDGSHIKISGLAKGDDYKITETGKENYELEAYPKDDTDNPYPKDEDGNVTLSITGDTWVDLVNTPDVICLIVDERNERVKRFYTLNRALEYAGEYMVGEARIQMLRDYVMPSSDKLTIPSGYNITLTSLEDSSDVKTIRRDEGFVSGSMFTNEGTFTLQGIILDGQDIEARDALISNSGTLTVCKDNIEDKESGNNVERPASVQRAKNTGNGGAIIMQTGTINIEDGASFTNNSAKNGGVIYATGGSVNINGGTIGDPNDTESNAHANSAQNGGVIYYSGNDTITVSGGTITHNKTTSGDGGAIFASGGIVDFTSGTISYNVANGNGGALYANNAIINLDGTTIEHNSAANGGAVFVETGSITMTAGTLDSNEAKNGSSESNGGAICLETGSVTVSGGTLSNNSAEDFGGAIYSNSGTVLINGSAAIGGDANKKNQAKNGAAVYLVSGTGTFNGSAKITYNQVYEGSDLWAAGGAIGVGSSTARLIFSGGIQVRYNEAMVSSEVVTSNVYLDIDSDSVISFEQPFSNGAYVGVYVPQAYESDLFVKRGTVCARFGSYTDNANNNYNFTSYIKNDRLDQVSVAKDNTVNKLYWYSPIPVQLRTLDNYFSALPTPNGTSLNGSVLKDKTWYNPPSNTNVVSVIAEDFVVKNEVKVDSRTYGGSFAYEKSGDSYSYGSSYADYVIRVDWDNDLQRWKATRRDGTTQVLYESVSGDPSWLVLYYANPAYLSIENNSEYTLSIDKDSFFVDIAGGNKPVYNTSEQAGYGYVVAIDGETQDALEPIGEANCHFVLNPGESVKYLFPGAYTKPFKFQGVFKNQAGEVVEPVNLNYTLNGTEYTQNSSLFKVPLSDDKKERLTNAGGTYEIIIGGKKKICKVVANTAIEGADPDTDKYVGTGSLENDIRTDEKVEYYFSTITDAVNFGIKYELGPKDGEEGAQPIKYFDEVSYADEPEGTTKRPFKVEMLTDYLIPTSDDITINTDGHDIVFTTALTGGGRYYPGTSAERRATISRDAGNIAPLINYNITKEQTGRLSVSNLDFDGRNLGGSNEFGAIKTYNCSVNIDHANFDNCVAKSGGAVSVDFIESYDGNYSFTVDTCRFVNCQSSAGTRVGGGAIWTCAKTFYLYNSYFEKCKASDQGGAVFHRIDAKKVGNAKKALFSYAPDTRCEVGNCQFINCEAGAAGGLETEAYYVKMTDCTFRNCKGITRNAGAVNIYIYEGSGDDVDVTTESGTTEAYFIGCSFENCSSKNRGGGLRSLSQITSVKDCTFSNCSSTNEGGAVCLANKFSRSMVIQGCTMDTCSTTGSGKAGGAIYCNAVTLEIGDYDYDADGRTAPTEDKRSNGIYYTDEDGHLKRSTKINNCKCSGVGGGVAHVRDVDQAETTITNATITGNTTTANSGGGVYINKIRKATITGCTIKGNTAKVDGGGVYNNLGQKDSTKYYVILDNCTVEENVASGKGGGVYVNCPLTLRNNTMIRANRLTSSEKEKAAGVYLVNDRLLTVGTTGASGLDTTSVMNNVTGNNEPSNMLLNWDTNKNKNYENSVHVLCNLNGRIGVIKAGKKGDKFGLSEGEYIGFSDSGLDDPDSCHVFVADDGSLYGVFSRLDTDHTDGIDIIWRGDIICKLTDANGHLLYLKKGSEPAIFDRLDYHTNSTKYPNGNGCPISPFSYLRLNNPELWIWSDEQKDYIPFDVNNLSCCVKMLVESYTSETYIDTGLYTNRTVNLTTAGRLDSKYPYTGKSGSRSTIKRGDYNNKSLFDTGLNLNIQNVILDGDGNNKTVTTDGGLIKATRGPVTVTLQNGAYLQNSNVGNDKSGGAVFIDQGCSLTIDGATIYNCSAQNGGGVYKKVTTGNFEFSEGLIAKCTAVNSGGGICLQNSSGDNDHDFTMSNSSQITQCSAESGGGAYIGNNRLLDMTRGSITKNTASAHGAGIATGSSAELYFSGTVTVSGNTFNGGTNDGNACNVELAYDSNTIIWTKSPGLSRGSFIGVYVTGTYIPLTEEQRQAGVAHNEGDDGIYAKHGGLGDPFGHFNEINGKGQVDENVKKFLYFFVNDRNGLKGGLKTGGEEATIYWVEIFSLEVSKIVQSTEEDKENDSFRFVVTLSGKDEATGNDATTITETSELLLNDEKITVIKQNGQRLEDQTTVSFEYGRAEFLLKDGQKVVWHNLPAGIHYTVQEYIDDSEQNQKYNTFPNEDNQRKQTGTIGENLNKDDAVSKYLSSANYSNLNVICKITTRIDGRPYLLHEIDYDSSTFYKASVYAELKKAFTDINESKRLYYKDPFLGWTEYKDGDYRIEMLIPNHTMPSAITLNAKKKVTLTTAKYTDKDGYPFADPDVDVATLKRGNYNTSSLYTVKGNLTYADIILDGNKNGNGINVKVNGGIANVDNGGVLNITDGDYANGTILQNSKVTDGSGGAICVNNGGILNMTGGHIGGKLDANGSVTLQNESGGNGGAIYLNGSNAKMTMTGGEIQYNYSKKYAGGAIRMENNSKLEISDNAMITDNKVNGSVESNGGAISVKSGQLTMTGGIIARNSACSSDDTSMGGAIFLEKGSATISGGDITGNSATTSKDGKFAAGGAIYVKAGSSPVLNLSGGIINSNTVSTINNKGTCYGAGIYLAEDTNSDLSKRIKLKISGNPDFGGTGIYQGDDIPDGKHEGDIIGKISDNNYAGNFAILSSSTFKSGDTEPLNGGKNYQKDSNGNYLVRQDVYIAGYEADDDATNATTMEVNGILTDPHPDPNQESVDYMPEGSIWIWAEKTPHYKANQQFALLNGDVVKTSENVELVETVLKAFRNARPDDLTGADSVGEYLHGTNPDKDSTGKLIYWHSKGDALVMLVKVLQVAEGGPYHALADKTISVYTRTGNDERGALAHGLEWDETAKDYVKDKELTNLTSGAGGAFFIGKLPYGRYYVVEDGVNNKHFEFDVNEDGVVRITGSGSSQTSVQLKTISLENN